MVRLYWIVILGSFLSLGVSSVCCARCLETELHAQGADIWSRFRPARFRGIRLGQDRIDRLVGKVGGPTHVQKSIEPGIDVYWFKLAGTSETISATVNSKGVVTTVAVESVDMPLDQAYRQFGKALVSVRYAPDPCVLSGESVPIYEDPKGDIVHLVDMERGTILWLNSTKTVVMSILYVDRPMRGQKPSCPIPRP